MEQLPETTEQDTGLAEWRKNNWRRILTTVEKTLMEVLDNHDASIKDKNEAARTLARMANILTPEKVAETEHDSSRPKEWYEENLTTDEQRELDRIINPATTSTNIL